MSAIDRNAPPQSVSSLLKLIDSGDLGMPEFQRNFIWLPGNVVDLLRTVARQWPCGTFLLQNGPQPYACKPLQGARGLKTKLKLLVLDGQQRLTALFQAFRERGDETYFVDMKRLIDSVDLEDEHIRYLANSKYRASYPTLEAEAAAGVVRVATLTRDQEFFAWVNHLPLKAQDRAIRLRDETLGGFKHYSIPCVILEDDLPLAAVAKIFETINRTGVRLDTFDLMVAKLFPFDFRLRDQWNSAQDEHESTLRRYGIEGIDILKAVALREHIRQAESPATPITVKGVRESDVLALEARAVKTMWPDAVLAYVKAVEFLRDQCGVIAAELIPSATMLLPLTAALTLVSKRRRYYLKDIKRWFWASGILQSYAQGANTQCVRDARALLAWNADETEEPEALAFFGGVDETSLYDARRRNEILLRTMLCAVARGGAVDWISGKPIDPTSAKHSLHRVFSKAHLFGEGELDSDAVVNYVYLPTATSKALSYVAPGDLLGEVQSAAVLESHMVPNRAVKNGDWDSFKTSRARTLATALNGLASEGGE